MTRDPFLEHARLGARSTTLIEYEEIPHLPRLKRRAREYALADLAHAVMLVEEGIVSADRGARLLAGLLDILDRGLADFPWDPQVGSYPPQAERYLAAHCGEDIAGRLQTGRSRNDQSGAAERLWMRDLLLEVMGDLVALERVVLARAEEHADALMPGYTHFQHAQPSTFGHALMRHASVLERDLQRLGGAFARTNLSAQGGAAMAGTSWPVNRARVAALLGHDGLVVNSADAGGFARDHLEEGVACLAMLMSNVGRLATDLFVWHSWEFGFVEVADALAGTSSIMPQKKNPHAFERVKALAGQAIGWLPAMMGCQRTVPLLRLSTPPAAGRPSRRLIPSPLHGPVLGPMEGRTVGSPRNRSHHRATTSVNACGGLTDPNLLLHSNRFSIPPSVAAWVNFPSVDAVQCSVRIQMELNSRNADLSVERRMDFRIGVNLGEVIVEGDRIYGME